MTSHRFFKMAAATWQLYFLFRLWWFRSIRKVEIYRHTKFRWDFSIHCWDITASNFLKQTSAMLEFYFGFRFHLRIIIIIILCISLPNFIQIGPPTAELWRHSDLKDGSHGIAFLLPLSFFMLRSIRKVEIHLPTKFRRYISIRGWVITTFGFWKQTSAVLEFYFRFRFLRLRYHRHTILHLPDKFCINRTIRDRVMTSYPFFQDGSDAIVILFRVSVFVISLIWEARYLATY